MYHPLTAILKPTGAPLVTKARSAAIFAHIKAAGKPISVDSVEQAVGKPDDGFTYLALCHNLARLEQDGLIRHVAGSRFSSSRTIEAVA